MMNKIDDGKLVVDDHGTTYYCLTNIARNHSNETPGYMVQGWLRSRNTLEFLKTWEQDYNTDFKLQEYESLLDRIKAGNFTLTPKQWIEKTGATGIVSKQGKSGGTYAHPIIACEFMTWIYPQYKMLLIKTFNLSQKWKKIKKEKNINL